MIERVAEAIMKASLETPALDNSFKFKVAKAAIEAMRDYRDNMNAKAEACDIGWQYTLDAMIDAALKED